jgi:hypothetical protein
VSGVARTYRHTVGRRVLNRVVRLLVRIDRMPGPRYLLVVKGRKSGIPRSTPVTLVEHEGARWLVAPYGQVGWVKNARAAWSSPAGGDERRRVFASWIPRRPPRS